MLAQTTILLFLEIVDGFLKFFFSQWHIDGETSLIVDADLSCRTEAKPGIRWCINESR